LDAVVLQVVDEHMGLGCSSEAVELVDVELVDLPGSVVLDKAE
jgi:hypothetical protein